jgi:heme exporter protein D
MSALGEHAAFIVASYAVFVAVLAGLILWLWVDGTRQANRLASFEARGIKRRQRGAPPSGSETSKS